MIQDSGHTFRKAAGRFASGVTVVTTRAAEGAYGVTVSSFASLSLNPLLVTVSISQSSQLLEHVRSVEAFAVSVLGNDQQQVAQYFATSGRRPEPAGFSAVRTIAHETGAPIIEGCLSWFDCILEDILPGGDHEIVVGRVAAAGGRSGEPLVYWAGGYRALTSDMGPELVEGALRQAQRSSLISWRTPPMVSRLPITSSMSERRKCSRRRTPSSRPLRPSRPPARTLQSGAVWRTLLINRS